MQGILSFDQQRNNANFVQQDTAILNTLEAEADHKS